MLTSQSMLTPLTTDWLPAPLELDMEVLPRWRYPPEYVDTLTTDWLPSPLRTRQWFAKSHRNPGLCRAWLCTGRTLYTFLSLMLHRLCLWKCFGNKQLQPQTPGTECNPERTANDWGYFWVCGKLHSWIGCSFWVPFRSTSYVWCISVWKNTLRVKITSETSTSKWYANGANWLCILTCSLDKTFAPFQLSGRCHRLWNLPLIFPEGT